MPDQVELYVYDLSNGLAKSLSLPLTGIQLDGIWHTAIVLRDREIYYGQGIQEVSPPGTTHHGRPVQVVQLGQTELDQATFDEYLDELRGHYRADKYHLLDFNCNSFTADVAAFLTGATIPSWISDLPAQFLATPFGQSLRPQIDAMFSPPGTGAAAASTTSAGPAAPPAPAANALSNTDLASTLLSHVAAAAASQPAAPAHATPAASAPDGTLSSPLHLATSPTSLRELIDQHDVAIVNFTAPKTCAPCRAIAPHFESLASLRAAELAGRKVAFVEVDLGVGRGSDAAQEWRVSATPTFVFFLRGRKTDELKGASARSLEAAVDRWLWQAFPPHPHESLPLPAVKAVSASPILYSAAPTWPALLGKLLPAIDRASSLTPEQRAEAKRLIEAEVVPFLQTKALAPGRTLEALVTAFAAQTDLLRQHLALDDVFPLYDLWRVALLDPKVCSLATLLSPTSSSSTKPLLHIFTDLFALPPAPPRAYVLTVLRLVANAFSFLGLALLLVSPSSPARTAFTALLVDSLLSPDESVKSAAAAIAFNVASVRHRSAAGAKGPAAVAVSTAQAEAGGEEEGDWALEIVFAVLEAIKNEQKKEDVLHRLVSALGLLLYKSPHTGELTPNLEVLDARSVLEGKLPLAARKDVRALVGEVAGQLC